MHDQAVPVRRAVGSDPVAVAGGRRPQPGAELSGDGLSLHLRTRTVRVAGQLVDLTGRETALLELLLLQRGQVVHPEQISHYLWGRARDPGSNAVGLLVGTLRGKIGAGRIDTVGECGFRYV